MKEEESMEIGHYFSEPFTLSSISTPEDSHADQEVKITKVQSLPLLRQRHDLN